MTVSALAAVTIEGYSGHTQGPNGEIVRIVVHGTVSACVRGGARQVAAYFQSAQSGGLAHYVVDPGEIVNCADEDIATWGAPPNQGEIHVELCDPQAGDPGRWEDADHQAMLKLAGGLVADIARRRGVPALRLSVDEVAANARGICGHAEVSAAFHQTDHQDPDVAGPFPWATFMALVGPAVSSPPEPLEVAMYDPKGHCVALIKPDGSVYTANADGSPGGHYLGGLNNHPAYNAGEGKPEGPAVAITPWDDGLRTWSGYVIWTLDASGNFHSYGFPSDGRHAAAGA